MLGRHLPFDAGVFDVPAIDEAFRAQKADRPTKVRIKHGGELSNLEYPFNPLDAEGWQGDLYPIRLNVRDIRTISSHRAEVVPSGHITFLSDRFHISTAMPAPPPTDPSVLKMPSFRDSVEFDQMLFVHDGHPDAQPFGLETGLLTLDPRGVTHGPGPHLLHLFQDEGASAAAHQCSLVMLNVRDPLTVTQDGASQPARAGSATSEDSPTATQAACVLMLAQARWSERHAEVQHGNVLRLLGRSGSFADVLDALLADLGLPRTLQDLGLSAEQVESFIQPALDHPQVTRNNLRPITTAADLRAVLQLADRFNSYTAI